MTTKPQGYVPGENDANKHMAGIEGAAPTHSPVTNTVVNPKETACMD